ncbi:MAG: hypothetical protein P1P74_12515 [Desulfuromonadales bacterium]|nr:hypothetical protein [Desulfuromonadales bacterium]
MSENPFLNLTDAQAAKFATGLEKVMREMDNRVVDLLAGARIEGGVVDATTILNSKAQMIGALKQAGFDELVNDHAKGYAAIVAKAKEVIAKDGGDVSKFTAIEAGTLRQLAVADVQGFNALADKTIDELRLNLYRTALSGQPFSKLVGIVSDTLENKLKKHAYTYANTTQLQFSGETVRVMGEALGADRWEVVGPSDEVTRDVCIDALADPIRTKAEWIAADYFGGTPGGYNCRHQLVPVFP